MTRRVPRRVRRSLAVGVVCGAAAVPASLHAQDPPVEPPWVLGIVEVPGIFGTVGPDGGRREGGPALTLRSVPDHAGAVAATVGPGDGLEAREYGYEAPGALVFGRREGWSLLRTRAGETGWLAPGDGGAFHSLEELLTDGLTYLTDAWDGDLRTAPGAADAVAVPPDPRREIVGYLEPPIRRIRVELRPGDDPDSIRAHHRASGSSLRTRPDGTRVLSLEVGTFAPLFARPDSSAPVVDSVESQRAGHVLAAASGRPTRVPVFGRRDGWLELALGSEEWRRAERVWLAADPAWRFTPVVDPSQAAAFMARVWGPGSRSVRVLDVRTVDGRMWVEVEALSDSPCVAPDEPTVVARGWTPAHAPSGHPTVWFHSRGC